jgi:hypothetical protein
VGGGLGHRRLSADTGPRDSPGRHWYDRADVRAWAATAGAQLARAFDLDREAVQAHLTKQLETRLAALRLLDGGDDAGEDDEVADDGDLGGGEPGASPR